MIGRNQSKRLDAIKDRLFNVTSGKSFGCIYFWKVLFCTIIVFQYESFFSCMKVVFGMKVCFIVRNTVLRSELYIST